MGLVGLLGGAIFSVYAIPDAFDPETFSGTGDTAVLYGHVLLVPLIFFLVGVVGLHRYHKDTYGRLGRASFYAVASGLILMISGFFYGYVLRRGQFDIFGIEDGAFIVSMLSFFVLVVLGSIPLGYATYRARLLPSVAPLALILSVPIGFATLAVTNAYGFVGLVTPYGLGWVILGYYLWSHPEEVH